MPNDEAVGSLSTPLVVVIGEGPSDIQYLESPLKAYYSLKYGTKCKLIPLSDVTGMPHYTDEEIMKVFPTLVQNELAASKHKINEEVAKNIKEIIHIIDIDEAFIDDSLIKEKKEKDKFFYTREGIEYWNPSIVKERNERKRRRIKLLRDRKTIEVFNYDIPYTILFFSINIDDFHYEDALNWSMEQKNAQAALFARTNYYTKSKEERIAFFKSMFSKNPDGFPSTIEEAWDYVSKDNNCLKICSNVIYKIKD